MAHVTSAEVKAAREALKAEFKDYKFSVTGGNSMAITVAIMEGPIDVSDDTRNSGYTQLNHYYLGNYEHGEIYKKMLQVMKDAIAKAGNPYFDKSDSMVDYFHCAYYYHLHIGKWNKPYIKK